MDNSCVLELCHLLECPGEGLAVDVASECPFAVVGVGDTLVPAPRPRRLAGALAAEVNHNLIVAIAVSAVVPPVESGSCVRENLVRSARADEVAVAGHGNVGPVQSLDGGLLGQSQRAPPFGCHLV